MTDSFSTEGGGYIQFADTAELEKFKNWLDKLEDDYLEQWRKDIAKARHDERQKVLAEIEGWLDEMPIWIDGVDMSPFRAELRAKLVEMREGK